MGEVMAERFQSCRSDTLAGQQHLVHESPAEDETQRGRGHGEDGRPVQDTSQRVGELSVGHRLRSNRVDRPGLGFVVDGAQ